MSKKFNLNDINKKLEGKNIKIIGEYFGVHIKTKFQCLIDGFIWETCPNNIFNGCGCPKCANHMFINNDLVDERLKNKTIKRIGTATNNRTKIEFECLIDGHRWITSPSNIFVGYGCPKCGGKLPTKSNEIVDLHILNSDVKRIGNYKNDNTKIEFECILCKNIWLVSPYNILRGRRCPRCSAGKSERMCLNIIKQNCIFDNITYHKLIYIKNKRYIIDFYLKIHNFEIFIEYNGKQHYEPVRFNNISQERADNNFKNQQIRDEIIRTFCKNNNIYLLEIPYYWDENMIVKSLININNLILLKTS